MFRRLLGARPSTVDLHSSQPEPTGSHIDLDYPVRLLGRWGFGKPSHAALRVLLNAGRDLYRERLAAILGLYPHLTTIKRSNDDPMEPQWINGWIPGLDSAALYAILAEVHPRRYVEVGSGTSTRFARKAIRDHALQTTLTSIDPAPRADIDALCDRVIREPLENINLELLDDLERDDVLFVDGSHRAFMNSDVTVLFTEVLPRVRPGVYVQLHDIWLPDDYHPTQVDRYYSEQYLLAVMLLSGGMGFEVVLPSWFVSTDVELSAVLAPLWEHPDLAGVETHGCSFWMRRAG